MENCIKIEKRAAGVQPVIDAERIISGHAVVYGVESQLLCERGERFIEVIEPGAISPELLRASDVKALFNHNSDGLLARSVKGEGSLTLLLDEKGLHFSFLTPNTTLGADVAELVRRGDIRGCSFAFGLDERDCIYSTRPDGTKVRRIRRISALYDVSIVVDPAYPQTSVSARSFISSEGDNKTKTMSLGEAKRILTTIF